MTEIGIVLLLLLISGAFSGTEVAFTSLSVDQLEQFKRTKGAKGRMAAQLHDRLDVVLTSITVGNNLANLAASALVSAFTIRLFGESWLPVSTVVLTILVLIIGEVTPKQIGIMHNEFVTLHMSRFLRVTSVALAPVIWAVRVVSNALTRLAGSTKRQRVTLEGLKHLVQYAWARGVLRQLDASIVRNVFRSTGAEVGAIMTHRTRIFSLEQREKCADVVSRILESGYSRVPVYDQDPEHIVGLALLKDVVKAINEGRGDESLKQLMITPVYVPETRLFDKVLADLRRERVNMAIVLDEYGGVAGLVTMEDLVEEFLGEIYDERETEEAAQVTELGPGEYWIVGETPLHVLNDQLELSLPVEGEANTIAGYVTEQAGHIPRSGETVATSLGTFRVERATHRRIVSVRFTRRNAEQEEHEED